jgi:hypothetical protein
MAQSPQLGALRDTLRKTIESSVAALSEEATDEDFVSILGSVGAMREVAQQILDLDASIEQAKAAGLSTDELETTRDRMVEALQTLTREMAR